MAHKRIAVVLGSTSSQGLSVVNALLKTCPDSVRGVTRDAHSEEAQALKRKGVEVVEGDLDNPQSLAAAFAVTKSVGGAVEREIAQGKNIANAAAAVETLEKFIWSTVPSASTVSSGAIAVPHMDGKAQVDEYIINSSKCGLAVLAPGNSCTDAECLA